MIVHHIGYLVKKLEKSKKKFLELGYETEGEITYDHYRKVTILFLVKDGYRVELIEPAAEDSVVSDLLTRYKNAPYHMCYESSSFEEDLGELREKGFVPIDEPCPAPALGGRRVAFLLHSSIGIIEILEA